MKFSELHPLSLIVFFVSVIAFSMVTMNPILVLLSFFAALCSNILIKNGSDIKLYLILVLAVCITNPLFSHNGETVLFYLFDQRITLEAFCYGFVSGIRLVGVIYWFRLFGAVFSQDKLNWFLGKMSPKLSVVFSMALRFIPLVRKNAKDIYNSQLVMKTFDTSTLKGKFNLIINVFSALISLSIENAIETADTMRSRGFENKNRSAFSLFRFRVKDILFIISVMAVDLVIALYIFSPMVVFYYYPSIRFENWENSSLFFIFIYVILFMLPVINDITENLRWKYSISKI